MVHYLVFTILLIFSIRKYNEKDKIKGKILYIHILLSWILLMMFSTSFKMLGWAIGHSEDIQKYFYIQVGIIPAWLNLLMWLFYLIFSIIATLLVFLLIQRKEKARKKLITLLPILYILTVYEMVKGFYKAGEMAQSQESKWFLVVLVCMMISLILFIPMYYFYTKKNVKDTIFIH